MSFVWKRPEGRLRTPEQVMAIIIGLVDGLNPPDKRGACVCAAMCVSAESDFWCPWNAAEPESKNYPFDSQSDDGRSVGYCQQQTGPHGELWWGPVSQEMSAEGSIGEFLRRLIKHGYNASNAQTANDSVQAVQQSGVPQGYRIHWDRANGLYDSVVGGAPPPAPPPPVSYGMPNGSNSGGYGGGGVKFPDWVYALGNAFGLKPSTYPGHQESDRNEAGYAPNPQHLNRGIDWAAPGAADEVDRMQRFADYLFSVRGELEQVIWWNPRTNKRIGVAGGKDVTTTPYYDYPGGYDDHRDHVHTRQSHSTPLPGGAAPAPAPVDPMRPDFNEYSNFSTNNRSRGGTKVDLFLIHTQEGDGNADSLSKFLRSTEGTDNPRSYHYAISEDYNDHGVTVVDACDTDNAAFAVGNSNNRSINLCFAGSRVAWSRDDWLRQSHAIDVAAYIAVKDCKHYGIATKVLAPPYNSNPPGISDHKYCGEWLKDGNTHTDVGPNFPWDVFAAAVNKYATSQPPSPTGEDELSAEAERKIDVIYQELTKKFPSRSPLRHLGEGVVDTVAGFLLNVDSSEHIEIVTLLARMGHKPSLALLWNVANADPVQYPDRQGDREIAQRILADVTSTPAAVTDGYIPAPVDNSRELAAAYAQIAQLREENARLKATAAMPAPSTEVAKVESEPSAQTPGDIAGQLIDSVEDWTEMALSMDVKQRAAMAASIKVLQTGQNGSSS